MLQVPQHGSRISPCAQGHNATSTRTESFISLAFSTCINSAKRRLEASL